MTTSSLPTCDLACAKDRLPLGMLSAHTCGLAPCLGCSLQVLWFGSPIGMLPEGGLEICSMWLPFGDAQ